MFPQDPTNQQQIQQQMLQQYQAALAQPQAQPQQQQAQTPWTDAGALITALMTGSS